MGLPFNGGGISSDSVTLNRQHQIEPKTERLPAPQAMSAADKQTSEMSLSSVPSPTPTPNTPQIEKTVTGKVISKPLPEYPKIAKAVRAQGTVVVQITVDEEGRVISASAVSGHPLLHQAAENAARQARFEPSLFDGKPVKVSGTLTYTFTLK